MQGAGKVNGKLLFLYSVGNMGWKESSCFEVILNIRRHNSRLVKTMKII